MLSRGLVRSRNIESCHSLYARSYEYISIDGSGL